jgi:hypothetical protein
MTVQTLRYRDQNETALKEHERRSEAEKMIVLRPAAVFARYDLKTN